MTVEDWVKLILQSNVVAAVVVGIFGLVTLKMGIAKYASEKWWERRASSYATVIDGLHSMHKAYSAWAEAHETRQELDNDYAEELSRANSAGFEEMQRGETIGAFLMSKRAADILRQLRAGIEADGTFAFGEVFRKRAGLVHDAIIAMMVEAKRDLKT